MEFALLVILLMWASYSRVSLRQTPIYGVDETLASVSPLRVYSIQVQCRSIVYEVGPTLILSLGLLYRPLYFIAVTAVSMLTHSLRRWPDIETAFDDCTV